MEDIAPALLPGAAGEKDSERVEKTDEEGIKLERKINKFPQRLHPALTHSPHIQIQPTAQQPLNIILVIFNPAHCHPRIFSLISVAVFLFT